MRACDNIPMTTPSGISTVYRVVSGTLANLPARAKASAILPPALIVVGDEVLLRQKLGWFGNWTAALAEPIPAG